MDHEARFSVGQLVVHRLFAYRGVIVDVDPCFMQSDAWYEQMALSRPPKDRPWYRVLVHGATHETYVAERNLDEDPDGGAIDHPELARYFNELRGGQYVPAWKSN